MVVTRLLSLNFFSAALILRDCETMCMKYLNKEDLLYSFIYDKINGELIWKNPPKRMNRLIGARAGYLIKSPRNLKPYLRIKYQQKSYAVHRLIWFIEKNFLSYDKVIDHINGNTLDNRIENLREVTQRKNSQNSYKHRCDKLVGASYIKSKNLYQSSIQINNKDINLGYFNTELEAHQRYLKELKARGLT